MFTILIPALVYLAVCLKDRIVRQDPSKWPCITYVVVGQTIRTICFIVFASIPQLYYATDDRYSDLCFFVSSLSNTPRVIEPVLLSFISVERMLALSHDVSSGISRKAAIITIPLALIIGYAISAGIYAKDVYQYTAHRHGCYLGQYMMFYFDFLPFLFVSISTIQMIVMSVILCKASCNNGKAGATGKTLPYIVANMAYILYFIFNNIALYFFGLRANTDIGYIAADLSVVIIILSWLFGDPTLRKAVCPCIAIGKHDEKTTLLKN